MIHIKTNDTGTIIEYEYSNINGIYQASIVIKYIEIISVKGKFV